MELPFALPQFPKFEVPRYEMFDARWQLALWGVMGWSRRFSDCGRLQGATSWTGRWLRLACRFDEIEQCVIDRNRVDLCD